MKRNKITKILSISTLSLLMASSIALTGCHKNPTKTEINKPSTSKQEIKPSENKATDNDTYKSLSTKNFNPGQDIVENVNNGKSTLNPTEWVGPKITYSNLDSEGRTGAATAYLNKDNYGKSEGRESQKWAPTGWHNQAKKVNGKRLFPQNRGHLIAYTLTFNLDMDGKQKQGELGSIDNPKNLFSQSAYSNQVTFQTFEEKVRNSIKAGHKVIYRVQPVFNGTELMARGLWAQAVSDDNSLNFNVYIYNVQPGLSFNYTDGTSKVDSTMTIKDSTK